MLSALYLGVVGFGGLLLIASIGRELFFRTAVVELRGPMLSKDRPEPAELVQCNEDVERLLVDLGTSTTELLSRPLVVGDHTSLGRRWEAFSRDWRRHWDEVNARCRFSELIDSQMGAAYDQMARVHGELPAMRLKFQDLLVRFDHDQAAELAEMRRTLDQSRAVLSERAREVSRPQP